MSNSNDNDKIHTLYKKTSNKNFNLGKMVDLKGDGDEMEDKLDKIVEFTESLKKDILDEVGGDDSNTVDVDFSEDNNNN